MFKKWLLLCIFCFSFSLNVSANMMDTYQFNNPQNRERAVALAKDMRCPQCQNQNLIESNSPIAYNLRLEVYQMVDPGDSNQQIIDKMTTRYGDFIRYDPSSNITTWLLWLSPFVLLAIAMLLLWIALRAGKNGENQQQSFYVQESHKTATTLSEIEQQNKQLRATERQLWHNLLKIIAFVLALGAMSILVYLVMS